MGRIIKAKDLTAQRRRLSPQSDHAASELVATWSAIYELRRSAKDDIIDLALTIARRVIGRAVALDKENLEAIYAQALGAAREIEAGIISVHPEDRASSRIDEIAGDRGFEVTEDPQVGRAGCRIKAGDVEVDATLDAVLDAMGAAMKGPGRE